MFFMQAPCVRGRWQRKTDGEVVKARLKKECIHLDLHSFDFIYSFSAQARSKA